MRATRRRGRTTTRRLSSEGDGQRGDDSFNDGVVADDTLLSRGVFPRLREEHEPADRFVNEFTARLFRD
jgi:hypothetical protein